MRRRARRSGPLARRGWIALPIVAAGFVGCGDDHPRGLAPPVVERPPVDDAIAAAVDLGARGCGPREHVGSGAFVDDDLVVTAAHVLAGSTTIRVIDASGGETRGDVVHFDPDLDLALVRTSRAVGDPIVLRLQEAAPGESGVIAVLRRDVEDGQLVVDAELVDVHVRRVARIDTTDIYLDRAVQRAGFELDGSVAPGDSGALVVLPGGGAGIVWARSNQMVDRAWAIDLPSVVTDRSARAALTAPVDTGPCLD